MALATTISLSAAAADRAVSREPPANKARNDIEADRRFRSGWRAIK
jgi:hypothetical protein